MISCLPTDLAIGDRLSTAWIQFSAEPPVTGRAMRDKPQPVAVSANTGTDTDVTTSNSRSLRLRRSRVAPVTSNQALWGKRGHQALAGAITGFLAIPPALSVEEVETGESEIFEANLLPMG